MVAGYACDEILKGGRGTDVLIGGSGDDVLIGGDGNDVFVFAISDKAANNWRLIAIGMQTIAAPWVFVKYLSGFDFTDSGRTNWAEVITASSVTLVLLAGTVYASRQSKMHRVSEHHMRWFALEINAIDPFVSAMPEDQQIELKKNLSEKLFAKNGLIRARPPEKLITRR